MKEEELDTYESGEPSKFEVDDQEPVLRLELPKKSISGWTLESVFTEVSI